MELAKIRQTQHFNLEVINIQNREQTKWKRKYVYWVPVLHIGGKEVAKGKWDGQTVLKALAEWQKTVQITDSEADADTSGQN